MTLTDGERLEVTVKEKRIQSQRKCRELEMSKMKNTAAIPRALHNASCVMRMSERSERVRFVGSNPTPRTTSF